MAAANGLILEIRMVHPGYRALMFHDPCCVLLMGIVLKALFALGVASLTLRENACRTL